MTINSKKGTLYIVGTPIGNLGDITLRALETLKSVDYIAAEDTRHSKQLLVHYGINKKLIALHSYNEQKCSARLLEILQQGSSIALISDAGTPLISDPGYLLVSLLKAEGIDVIGIPGPCAAILALSVAGLPTDKFIFEGFLSTQSGPRKKRFKLLQNETRTMVFYEAPHRILDFISDAIEIFGAIHNAVIARELTKKFETVKIGKLATIQTWLETNSEQLQGEFVVLIAGTEKTIEQERLAEAAKILRILAKELPKKQAAKLTNEITGVPTNDLYKKLIHPNLEQIWKSI